MAPSRFGSRRAPSASLAASKKGRVSRLSYTARLRVDRFIMSMRDHYLAVQTRVLEQRWAFLGLSVAALFFAVNLNRHVPVDLFPSDFSHIMATVEAPTDYGIDKTSAIVAGMESALDPIITVDHRGVITEFNRAAEQTFGHRREDVLGTKPSDVLENEGEMVDCHLIGHSGWADIDNVNERGCVLV